MGTSLARTCAPQMTELNRMFSPLFARSVGFDRILDSMGQALAEPSSSGSYPPYDIIAVGDDRFEITVAVAGFGAEDLDVQVENGTVTVVADRSSDLANKEVKYLHRGIAHRRFVRRFNLAEHIQVEEASLKDGMLTIALVRELPEALKPRSVEVRVSSP